MHFSIGDDLMAGGKETYKYGTVKNNQNTNCGNSQWKMKSVNTRDLNRLGQI